MTGYHTLFPAEHISQNIEFLPRVLCFVAIYANRKMAIRRTLSLTLFRYVRFWNKHNRSLSRDSWVAPMELIAGSALTQSTTFAWNDGVREPHYHHRLEHDPAGHILIKRQRSAGTFSRQYGFHDGWVIREKSDHGKGRRWRTKVAVRHEEFSAT